MELTVSKATMTIGELADRFGVGTHVLRYWESVGLMQPAKRVNGRRFYGEAQAARVTMIVRGKEAGFGLAQLRDMLNASDPATRKAILERHHAALEQRIAEAQVAMEMVEHALHCPHEDFTECPRFLRIVAREPHQPGECTLVHEADDLSFAHERDGSSA
jgi:DNA-binding transcriptional MerR regulator